MESNFDYTIKYIIIGDAGVGKSNLVLQYVEKTFKPEYANTVGVEFAIKTVTIENKVYGLQLWDTAGQENFRSIARGYYKTAACAIVVYDITCRDSFNNVKTWIEECKNSATKTITFILIGNKSDLAEKRAVTEDEGRELAESYGIQYYETSAKTGTNVEKAFSESLSEIIKKIEDNLYDLDDENCGVIVGSQKTKSFSIEKKPHNKNTNSNKKKKCC